MLHELDSSHAEKQKCHIWNYVPLNFQITSERMKVSLNTRTNSAIKQQPVVDAEWGFQTNTLSQTFILQCHWNNNPWIDMSFHSDSLSSILSQPVLLFLLNAACFTEKQQISISVFGLTRQELEPMIYNTRGEHVNN